MALYSVETARNQLLTQLPGAEEESSDDDFGPALPSAAAPKKKRRKLPFEKVYVNALPSSARYSKSLMHKDQLSFVTMSPYTDFLLTSSIDGVVKFWKKMAVGVEFVKEFRAHIGEIRSTSVSADGRSFATVGADKTVKIFDVITFGMAVSMCGGVRLLKDVVADSLLCQICWLCILCNTTLAASAGFIDEALHYHCCL